jgi:hypothetical protein
MQLSFIEVSNKNAIEFVDGTPIEINSWNQGRYCPTPTIIEAAKALYNGHSVADISRSDASAINLSNTSDSISAIIEFAKRKQKNRLVL